MSETTTAPAKPLDEFGQMAKDRLRATIEEYNVLAARVKAATGDPQELLESLRDTYSDDEQVVKIRAKIDELTDQLFKLEQKRDEVLRPVVEKMVADAKQGNEGVEAELTDKGKTIAAGRKYLTDLYGDDVLSDLPPLVGKRRASTGGGGGGTGARRIRGFDVYVDGTLATGRNGKGEQVSNMAAAAKFIGVDTDVMREQFWAAAGTDDSSKYPATVEFAISVGEGDDRKTHSIRAVKVADGEARATEQKPAE